MSALRRPSGQIRPVTVNLDRKDFFFPAILFEVFQQLMDEDLEKRAIEDLPVVN